jgi:acetylornithine deacetylase
MAVPDLMSMISALIAAPSVSSVNPQWDQSNAGVIALLAEWLEALGFTIEILPIPGCPGKSNLVANRGSGPDGLVLSGHTDTVPFDEGQWHRDPFHLTEVEGRIYGLGTSDMKSFFAIAIEALKDLPLDRLQHPLTIIATADEESTMCGARSLVDTHRRLGRHAIIGEPTGLKPVRLHKGVMMEAIRLYGRSGHSSNPLLGVSALDGMHRVMGMLLEWRGQLQRDHRNPLFETPFPTMNLGHIHGGDNPNRICSRCELQIDLRPLPGMRIDALREELRERTAETLKDSDLRFETEPLFEGIPAMETPADAPIVQAAERLTGHPSVAVAFGTEGPFFNSCGMQTLILGPGDIDQAHQPDEYLALSHIGPAIELLQSLVGQFCLSGEARQG